MPATTARAGSPQRRYDLRAQKTALRIPSALKASSTIIRSPYLGVRVRYACRLVVPACLHQGADSLAVRTRVPVAEREPVRGSSSARAACIQAVLSVSTRRRPPCPARRPRARSRPARPSRTGALPRLCEPFVVGDGSDRTGHGHRYRDPYCHDQPSLSETAACTSGMP